MESAEEFDTEGGKSEWVPENLPEPLASVVAYLSAELDEDGGRDFIPTAELVEVLGVEPTAFGRQMSDVGCSPRKTRVTGVDGEVRQARGYLMSEIRAAVSTLGDR
jgi:DNA segregation ATPase FtsK/SpoIIIE, S-DNA-T family